MWTLVLLLGIAGFIVTKAIESVFSSIKKPVYPSTAFIDQLLPSEIIEQIFVNLDYEALIACNQVNKYWNYLSSNKKLRNQVCQNSNISRPDPHELLENWNYNYYREFDLTQLTWLDYPENYKPEWHHQDRLLARRLGKKLVDVDLNSAKYIRTALDVSLDEALQPPNTKWLAKFRCKTQRYDASKWFFDSIHKGAYWIEEVELIIERHAIPNNITFEHDAECELIVDLTDVSSEQFQKVHRLRYLNKKNLGWLGLPWDYSLINIGVGLFSPCLLADYWQLNSSLHFWINLVVALLVTGGIVFAGVVNLLDGHAQQVRRRADILFMLITLVLALCYFYNWMLEIGFLLGCVIRCVAYYFTIDDLRAKNHPYAKHVAIISALLVILTLDWKLVVRAIGSGKIYYTLLYNTTLYLLFGLLFAIYHGVIDWLQPTQNTVPWKMQVAKDYVRFFLATVPFITLFAPESMQKVLK